MKNINRMLTYGISAIEDFGLDFSKELEYYVIEHGEKLDQIKKYEFCRNSYFNAVNAYQLVQNELRKDEDSLDEFETNEDDNNENKKLSNVEIQLKEIVEKLSQALARESRFLLEYLGKIIFLLLQLDCAQPNSPKLPYTDSSFMNKDINSKMFVEIYKHFRIY